VLFITFSIYIILIVAIGYWSFRQTETISDYILGGRKLGALPSALSAGASDMSGWLLLGLPGAAYVAGISAAWIAIGLLIGTSLNWMLVAKRLRRFSANAKDALTIPDYLENRFADKSRSLRIISAVVILFFFLIYTSSGLVAGGKLFETVFGVDYQLAVIIGTIAVVSYTGFGGFLAVSWTDVLQGLLMLLALVLVPVVAVNSLGGVGSTLTQIRDIDPNLLDMFKQAGGSDLGWITVVSSLAWGLGYFGQPHILSRFMAIKSESEVPKATVIAISWTAITLTGAVLVGVLGLVYLSQQPTDSESVFMLMIDAAFHPLVAGILLAAILAAIMSTADSQLLVCSSTIAEDFYRALYQQDAPQKSIVLIGRLAVVIIAAIAAFIAMDPNSKVLTMVSYAWAGFGAAFGPVLILSLYWQSMTRLAALCGIVVGALTVVVWEQLSGGIYNIYALVPAFIFSTLSIIVISLVAPKEIHIAKKLFAAN